MTTKYLKIENCLDCPHSKRVTSPYTGDSFDMADENVVCTKTPERKTQHNPSGFRAMSVSERSLTQQRKDCKVPSWCPL